MKKLMILLLGGALILTSYGAGGIEFSKSSSEINNSSLFQDEYPIGSIIWEYTITDDYDTSPKAIAPIEDINDDTIDDVVVCSEDDYIRCFDGGARDTGVILWEHEIYAGSVYSQKGLTITEDINDDGYQDVVVGAAWGARLIRAISGKTGEELWTHDTHEYGDGGWVYQVDSSYDYNDDGINDILAATGDDANGIGPKRVYCLDALTGVSIWEYFLSGPGFSVVGVMDFTGDGVPDAVAGCSNELETIGFAKGINGATGLGVWSFSTAGSSVWAVAQIDDASGDGIEDVIIGDFEGHIYGLNAATGNTIFSNSLGSVIITRFAVINDANNDGYRDIVPAHSSIQTVYMINGQNGDFIWTQSVVDQPWNVARSEDLNDDNIDEVFVGTLYNDNYCYIFDGETGSTLAELPYGEPVDAIGAIPDVIGDGSGEMVAGGRYGRVVCFSGGLGKTPNEPPETPVFTGPTVGRIGIDVEFSIVTEDPEDDDVSYFVDWGDGTQSDWTDLSPSGEPVSVTHNWSSAGEFEITVKARDDRKDESNWTEPHAIAISENTAPETPTVTGRRIGFVGRSYTFAIQSSDPENDNLRYLVKWGDGSDTGWIGAYASGEEFTVNYTWSERGEFLVIAKAQDLYGAESDWGSLRVFLPMGLSIINVLKNSRIAKH